MAPIEASGTNSANAALEAFRTRALNAVGTAAVTAAKKPFASVETSPLPTASSVRSEGSLNPVKFASQPKVPNLPEYINVDEIQQIAARSGYVGLTQGAIQRAYLYGESLLTDIRA